DVCSPAPDAADGPRRPARPDRLDPADGAAGGDAGGDRAGGDRARAAAVDRLPDAAVDRHAGPGPRRARRVAREHLEHAAVDRGLGGDLAGADSGGLPSGPVRRTLRAGGRRGPGRGLTQRKSLDLPAAARSRDSTSSAPRITAPVRVSTMPRSTIARPVRSSARWRTQNPWEQTTLRIPDSSSRLRKVTFPAVAGRWRC